MTDWFRSWHGAPTDPKWRTIARHAKVRPGDVFAVISYLWDRASQSDQRGSVDGYDAEVIADSFGYEVDEVERIIAALIDKNVVVSGRIAAWEKYQPKREGDNSTARSKEHRDRKKNATQLPQNSEQCNAMQRNATQCNDREEERREEEIIDSSDSAEAYDPARNSAASNIEFLKLKPESDFDGWLRGQVVGHALYHADDIGLIAPMLSQGVSQDDIRSAVSDIRSQSVSKIRSWKSTIGWIRAAHESRTSKPRAWPKFSQEPYRSPTNIAFDLLAKEAQK